MKTCGNNAKTRAQQKVTKATKADNLKSRRWSSAFVIFAIFCEIFICVYLRPSAVGLT